MERRVKEFVLKAVYFAILGALGGIALANIAHAENVKSEIGWTQPMTYEDGTAMPESDLADYELHYTIDKGFELMPEPIRIKPSVTGTYTLTLDLAPRAQPYTLNMAMRTTTIYGKKSQVSNIVSESFKINNTGVPSAPVNLKFEMRCDSTCEIILTEIN